MTTEEALREYLATRGMIPREIPRDEWYRENWARVAMWGRRIPVFPVYGFKESLFIHDIHHLLSGYDTDWTGELEIAAWPGITARVIFSFESYPDGRTAYLIPLSAIAIEVGIAH